MQYRRDIDGLRAIAVLPVVLYHIQLGPFSGGFVGVDIFFVISGYLITGIIAPEISENRFSLLRFYERRIRRIFPALFAMLGCVLLAGLVMLPPEGLKELGKSILFTVPFLSNVYFSQVSDYFATPAELKPLLHTWSLAVEEQFYLVFPLALLFIQRLGKRLVAPIIVVSGAVSFAASTYLLNHGPVLETDDFYDVPFRAWELLIGAGLALKIVPTINQKWVVNGLAVLGVVMLGAAVFLYDDATPFPGAPALLPCLGAALLMYTGSAQTWPARILGAAPLVFIGRLSYSLYLWHWPILVFWRIKPDHVLGWTDDLVILALSLLAAWLSWRFVERPFRNPSPAHEGAKRGFSRRAIFAGAGLVSAALAAASFAIVKTNGVEKRFPDYAYLNNELKEDERVRAAIKEIPCNDPVLLRAGISDGVISHGSCMIVGDQEAAATLIVWGDSHARAWLPAFDAAGRAQHQRAVVISTAGCPPLLGVRRTDRAAEIEACQDPSRAEAVIGFIGRQQPRQIYLVARWSLYSFGHIRNGRLERETHFLVDGADGETATHASSMAALKRETPKTIAALEAIAPVTVMRNVPLLGLGVRHLALLPAGERDKYLPTREAAGLADAYLTQMKLPDEHDAQIYDPRLRLCTKRCAYAEGGHLLYVDDNHLSAAGAMLFEADIEAMVRSTSGSWRADQWSRSTACDPTCVPGGRTF